MKSYCLPLLVGICLTLLHSSICGDTEIETAGNDVTYNVNNKTRSRADSGSDVITIKYDNYKVATGGEAEFKCSAEGYDKDQLIWISPNGTAIDGMNSTRFQDDNGVLTIANVQLHDAGDYTCLTDDALYNRTVELVTYVMPDYFYEGMIVLAINGVLIVIFCTCLVVTTIKQKRELKKYKKIKQIHLKNPGDKADDDNVNGNNVV